jgi:hypothetical protein
MLWSSAKTVGFGYAGSYIVARYCSDAKAEYPKPPTSISSKNIPAFGLNVCKVGGCNKCPLPIEGIGYNNCYNTDALEYINNLRKIVSRDPLKFNVEYAIKAQSWASTFSKRGSGASSDQARPANCAALHFQ